jgi:cell division protein FtsL
MASAAPSPHAEAPRARTRRAASERKQTAARQRRVAGSVVWIVVVAVLLAGVVAVNVAVLRLSVRLDQVSRERAKLQAENAALQSQLARAAASRQIEDVALNQLGLVRAGPENTTYITLAQR